MLIVRCYLGKGSRGRSHRRPCGSAAVTDDASELRVGEVDAEADGSGLFEFGAKTTAMTGGDYGVVVDGCGPFGMADLNR